jgi:hypothetical protein
VTPLLLATPSIQRAFPFRSNGMAAIYFMLIDMMTPYSYAENPRLDMQ